MRAQLQRDAFRIVAKCVRREIKMRILVSPQKGRYASLNK
jgi:hypothetical protein